MSAVKIKIVENTVAHSTLVSIDYRAAYDSSNSAQKEKRNISILLEKLGVENVEIESKQI